MENFCCSHPKTSQLTPTTTDDTHDYGPLRVSGFYLSEDEDVPSCVRLSSLFSEVFVYETESSLSHESSEVKKEVTPREVEKKSRRRKRKRTISDAPMCSLELAKPVEVASDAMFSDRVSLVPWLTEDSGILSADELSGGHLVKVREWARQTATVLDFECFNEETTNMMMREIEEKTSRRSYFQTQCLSSAPQPSSRTGQRRFLMKLKSALLYLSSGSARQKNKMGIDVLRLRPHGRMLLGEMRWTRLLDGIRVWAFFGFSALTKIDCHIFYLDQTTGWFKLARLPNEENYGGRRFYLAGSQTQGTNRGAFTSSDFVQTRNTEEVGSPAAPKFGRNFPLDTLSQIDRSRRLSSTVLSDPALASMNLSTAVAMWSNNTLEPLVCASANQNDIDDLISVIRFLQFYNGMNPAQIVDDTK